MDFRAKVGSRFSIEDGMLSEIASWADTELQGIARRLREYVGKQMLPEAADELITKQNVLIQFGVSDERAIFPCPSAVEPVPNPVLRQVATTVVDALAQGMQKICLHGAAGVGKTTVLQEIATALPGGSEMVLFDCYGGGRYLDASQFRHRPRDAFLQLSNDLARLLRLPMLLQPNASQDFARAFRRRLSSTAETLERVHPGALLVIAVDAADNSITAALGQTPTEASFVTELMSFADLRSNISLIISARTGRLEDLNLPPGFAQIECSSFTLDETAGNVARYCQAQQSWIEDFHHLSAGVPRVQAYAFQQARDDWSNALAVLRPAGLQLEQIFAMQFEWALRKAGQIDLIEQVCAGLATLPRPIPAVELAHVLNLSVPRVMDVCSDLAPGVRSQNGLISFADEDFEAYVREKGLSAEMDIRRVASDRLLANADSDEYAALNVAHVLFLADKKSELLEFVEQEPKPNEMAISDPVRSREIHDQRLLIASKVCRDAGDTARALRFVLMGAEAAGSSEATQTLLTSFPMLAAKFGKETASRIILHNPQNIEDHGNLIFFSIGEDGLRRNAVGVREGRRQLRAWLEARTDAYEEQVQEHQQGEAWPLSSEAIAADISATALLDGIEPTKRHFKRVRSLWFAISVAKAFVHRMLGEGRHELVEDLALKYPPWKAIFLLVPLARAGREIDLDRLADGLRMAKRRLSLGVADRSQSTQRSLPNPDFLDTVLSAMEILVGHGVHMPLCMDVLSKFLDSDLRRIDRLKDSDVSLLDAFLRSHCLKQEMAGEKINSSDVLLSRPAKAQETTRRESLAQRERARDKSIADLLRAVTPVYEARAQVISAAGHGNSARVSIKAIKKAVRGAEWRFDRHLYSSEIRARVTEVLSDLIAVGANPHEVMEHALTFRRGLWPQGHSGIGEFCKRLTAVPELHGDILGLITKEVEQTMSKRTGAYDKSNALAAFAELLIPLSLDDAKIVFGCAIEVAGELEVEMMDQLRFLDRLVGQAKTAIFEDRRYYASMTAEIVSDAAIRLDGTDHFPWDEAMSSIAKLDFSTALASVARWDDLDVAWLGTALWPVLAVGLQEDHISSAQAAALSSLDDRTPLELLESIMAKAVEEGSSMASALADEFAHDSLVDRLPTDKGLRLAILKHGQGEWTNRYRRQGEFASTLPNDSTAASEANSQSANSGSTDMDGVEWNPASLINADDLLNDATDVLARLRSADGDVSLGDVLKDARGSVRPGDRRKHLDALAKILSRNRDWQLIDVILSAAQAWHGQLAVKQWCRSMLPKLIFTHLPGFARYLPWEDFRLTPASQLAELSCEEVADCLLNGLALHADNLESRAIFAIAGLVASRLSAADAGELCKWYLDRLLQRIPVKDRESIDDEAIPSTVTSTVARFVYAYMSDVDLRLRWRAAHALRRLARLGERASLAETVAQYERLEEPAFRAGSEPFYWIAARLWLVIALDRLSDEAPEAVISHAQELVEISSSNDFPHVLIRDYAADACQTLIANDHLTISNAQKAVLDYANKGLPPLANGKASHVRPAGNGSTDADARRFRFDSVDTVRYWYARWLSVFHDLTQTGFLDIAETWIVDRWGVNQEIDLLHDSRRQRFRHREFNLSSNSHGSIPTLERYRNYLEWHAMWCTLGELLKSHRLTTDKHDDYDSLPYAISGGKLTHPPHWLSDFVGPTPLQPHRWQPIDEPIDDWLSRIDDSAFEREIFPVDRPGWVVVGAYMDVISDKRQETVSISTGLVSPDTAHALVRALQVATSERDFYVCPEGHELEINMPGYRLQGWLTLSDSGTRYDDKDPYCNDVAPLQGLPGKVATEALGLERRYCNGCLQWFRKGSQEPSFIYESWGQRKPESPERHYYDDSGAYSGRRLLVKKEDLAEFLRMQERDLILDIGVNRDERRPSKKHSGTERARSAVFNRILFLGRNGRVEAAERSFEAWLPHSP